MLFTWEDTAMTTQTFSPPPELGLGDATLQPLERLTVPESAEGVGLALTPALPQVVTSLLSAPHTAERILPATPRAAALSEALGDLRWWSRHPGIYVVDSELEARLQGGDSQRLPEGELIIDARAELTWLRLQGRGVDAVWQLDASGATLHLVGPADAPSSAPELEVPEAAFFVGNQPIAPWLRESFGALARAPSLLSRIAAVGMLGRLWAPHEAGKLSLEELLALRLPGPAGREWLQAQPLTLREEVVAEAVATASLLRVSFGPLEEAILSGAPEARERAREWVRERDRLESVCFALGGREAPEALRRALTGLDRYAAVHHSLWSLLPGWTQDAHLAAVAARDPEAWWGRLSAD